jgi:hypothetical protein
MAYQIPRGLYRQMYHQASDFGSIHHLIGMRSPLRFFLWRVSAARRRPYQYVHQRDEVSDHQCPSTAKKLGPRIDVPSEPTVQKLAQT